MGTYSTIRGWIEIHESLKASVQNIIKSSTSKCNEYRIANDIADFYNSGWVIQSDSINGALFAFYGGKIRTHAVDFIKIQIIEISKLFTVDEDFKLYPEGYFHIDEDGTHGLPPEEWIISESVFTVNKRK